MNRFNGICLLTPDVDRLGRFYQQLLACEVIRQGDNLSFVTGGADFTIFSHQGMQAMSPGSMEGVGFGSFTVEIEVDDVDQAYANMLARGVPCIKPPITYPWGRRSAWFRDPDGNIVNLFMRAGD